MGVPRLRRVLVILKVMVAVSLPAEFVAVAVKTMLRVPPHLVVGVAGWMVNTPFLSVVLISGLVVVIS